MNEEYYQFLNAFCTLPGADMISPHLLGPYIRGSLADLYAFKLFLVGTLDLQHDQPPVAPALRCMLPKLTGLEHARRSIAEVTHAPTCLAQPLTQVHAPSRNASHLHNPQPPRNSHDTA